MPTFSWTSYSFDENSCVLPLEGWNSIKEGGNRSINKNIEKIKSERWKSFWKDQSILVYMVGVFVICVPLFILAEENSSLRTISALGVFLTGIPTFSVFVSAISHSNALSKQCQLLRKEFSIAVSSVTYEEYLTRRNQ